MDYARCSDLHALLGMSRIFLPRNRSASWTGVDDLVMDEQVRHLADERRQPSSQVGGVSGSARP
jgi:hypothetical protein